MVRDRLEGTVRLSLLALAFFYLLDVFIGSSFAHWGLYAVLVFLLVNGLFLARGVTLFLSSAMLLAGHILLFLHKGTFYQWGEAITKNVPLLSLLILVPLIQIPFQAGGYLTAVERFVRRSFDSEAKVVTVFGTVVFVVGSLLNLGGLRFLTSLAAPLQERFGDLVLRVMCRSFVSAMMWSPYFATVGLTLVYLHLPVKIFLLPALLVSLMSLMGASVYTLIESNGFPGKRAGNPFFSAEIAASEAKCENQPMSAESKRKLAAFMMLLLLLLATALTVEHYTRMSMLTVISVLSLGFPLIMFPFVDRKEVLNGGISYWKGLERFVTEVMLFTSAGFMGGVLSTFRLGTEMSALYAPFARAGSYAVILALMLTVLVLTFVFIHPILTTTVLLTSVPAEFLGIHPVTMGLSVLAGWSAAMTVSVITPFIVIMSGLFGRSLISTGWHPNKWYMIFVTLFLSFVIWGMDRFLMAWLV